MQKIILTLFVFFTAITNQAFAGNFSQSCENITLKNSRLSADCKRKNQSVKATKIDLDKNIGNLDGVLSWGDRNFSKSCSNIVLNGAALTATCKRKDGSENSTSLNLDEGIDNTNGVLKFD